MIFTLYLLAVYAALATACYFPRNDARYANRTLWDEHRSTVSDVAGAWLTVIGGDNAARPWPCDGDTTTIYYCYQNQEDKDTLKKFVEAAAKKWTDKLGAPNVFNQHRFAGFKEHPKFSVCFDDDYNWHEDLPYDTLRVDTTDDEGEISHATLGYIPKETWKLFGRHNLHIERNTDFTDYQQIHDVAHEMGHVLGLVHEHQGADRDDWVHFDCTKLVGYTDAKAQYDKDPKAYPSIDEICASNWMADEYFGWEAPAEFSTDMGVTLGKDNIQKSSTNYDKNSIMTYPSWAWTENHKGGVEEVAFVYWKTGGAHSRPPKGAKPTDENSVLVWETTEISYGDIDFVRTYYPW